MNLGSERSRLALLREITDHDCEVTEVTRESSFVETGPGIVLVSIQRAAQQGWTVDDSEDGDDRDDSNPAESLDTLTNALGQLNVVLAVELHDRASRESEGDALPATDNTRLDEMFATEMGRLDREGRGWIELLADGTLLSPAILREIAAHGASVSEVIYLDENYTAAAVRGAY